MALRSCLVINDGRQGMFANISTHMEVVGVDDGHVGTIDTVEGFSIKLAKSIEPSGREHFVPLDWIDHVDDKVHLSMTARDVIRHWRTAA
jgi:hypothetical protein